MTAFERELRRVLADPPVEDLPDPAAPLAGLERRVVHARRRRTAASAISVAAVLAFGVSGAAALTRPIPAAPATADNAAALPAAGNANIDAPVRRPPEAVLDAARRALAASTGVPDGSLYWVATGSGNATVYVVQIPVHSSTSCRVCRDPAAVPSGGAVLELRVGPTGPMDAAGSVSPPRNDHPGVYPGYTARTTDTRSDLRVLGAVYGYPVPR